MGWDLPTNKIRAYFKDNDVVLNFKFHCIIEQDINTNQPAQKLPYHTVVTSNVLLMVLQPMLAVNLNTPAKRLVVEIAVGGPTTTQCHFFLH